MAKVLILFVKSDEQESKKLKDCLQAKLGDRVDVITVIDAIAEGNSLERELSESRCVVFVSSKQSSEFLKQGTPETEGSFVLFDGKLIQEQLKKGLLTKLVVVQFGENVRRDIVPAGYDKEVFLLDENFNASDPVLNQIDDTVKGFLSSNKQKKEEKKGGCTVV